MGSKAIGSKDVAGIGMGSKIHQIAHKIVMLAVAAGANSQPEIDKKMYKINANAGPSGSNHRLITNPLLKTQASIVSSAMFMMEFVESAIAN